MLLFNTVSGAVVGPMSMGTEIDEVLTDFSQGSLRDTGEPLDIALEGPGFLAVQSDAGLRFVRGGRMIVDGAGRLTTSTGLPLLGVDGQPILVVKETGITITAAGLVSVDGKQVGQLALVALPDAQKQGSSLFLGNPIAPTEPIGVRQGSLEASGVDAARVMVDMIMSLRSFESSQRVLRSIDETLGRAINSAGSVSGS
jgi:flagellar basal body rod protein FlgG